MWVRILRNVYVGSEVFPAGRETELDHFTAKLLIGAGKAQAIPGPVKAPEPVKASKPKPAPVTEPAIIEDESHGN